ncbi:MAG: RibD family protein [Omnitrophica WOR_2 bacterium]
MPRLTPFESLIQVREGDIFPLPPDLDDIYGELKFPSTLNRPYVYSNFVETLDGVVTLAEPGHESGADISGRNPHDMLLMGILRSASDAVVITTGSLKVSPDNLWTGESIYPQFGGAYRQLRDQSGLAGEPAHVIVTATGEFNIQHPVIASGKVKVLILTTSDGLKRLSTELLPNWVQVVACKGSGFIESKKILAEINRLMGARRILVEAGPHLNGMFIDEHCLDELFLTLSSQVAGSDGTARRLGFVANRRFGPENPVWSKLNGVKRAGDFLFLRYRF